MSYRFDPDTRQRVADLLMSAVPAYFRVEDAAPAGRDELRQLLKVLAAPLGLARQNIEELHANLFIDSSDDWVLRYLADMVGTVMVFPDAASNRRDIRETVSFRRRKGTPRMLEDMGNTLTERVVVTQEGWKLVQMTQDLDLLRPERVLPDIRPAILAETESGPLCATHHLLDIRSISRATGIFHPKHVVHWAHPTLLFPLLEGFPFERTAAGDPDLRFAFHPLGVLLALRARRVSSSDRDIRTDRIPPMHFDRTPGIWFGRDGRFSVDIAGIPAAVAAPQQQPRVAAARIAGPEVADGAIAINLLDHDPRAFQAAVRVTVAAVDLNAGVPDTATAAAVDERASVDLSAAGAAALVPGNVGAIDPNAVVMIRLSPVAAGAPFFPGAVVEIVGEGSVAGMASADFDAAQQGMLRGALIVRIPPTFVDGDRWFVVAIDGSAYQAQPPAGGAADIVVSTLISGDRVVPRSRLLTEGPGPAWPPTPPAASPSPLTAIPNAPGRGPAILHGGRVVVPAAGTFDDIGAGDESALVFALRTGAALPAFHPFLRLSWTGPSPLNAVWTAIDDAAAVTPLDARLSAIALIREQNPGDVRLLVRLECDQADARLTPCEIAWPGYDGRNTLAYLPELVAEAVNPNVVWPAGAGVVGISTAAALAEDGSSWDETMLANRRRSSGRYAPMREYAAPRRRRVRYRRLCAWDNEVPPLQMLPGTPDGQLDVDVEHGLFAMSVNEAIQPYPDGAGGGPPPSLTVMYQDGYTAHTGARPAAREPLIDARLETPTRIVSASGRLHSGAPPSWFSLPRYASLGGALDDIAAAPHAREVVQFEDSATYAGESLTWPAGPDDLVIQAAERERPTIVIASWAIAAGATYDNLEILGVGLGADADGVFELPPSAGARLRFMSILRRGMTLRFDLTGAAEDDRVEIDHALMAGLELEGTGRLQIRDSVIDAREVAGDMAITADEGEVHLERTTLAGEVACRVIHASETIFNDDVMVTDRFRGCVRYSRVTSASVLPRIHRVVEDVALAFESRNRHDPAHVRLSASADRRVLAGAEDGSEMGAFHDVHLALRYEGYRRRLEESTPAGLMTGIIRLD
jgi:hypothetical protein